MTSKSLVSLGLSAMFMLSLIARPINSSTQTHSEPIVFAHIDPFSGPIKDVGIEASIFAEYAIERINTNGGVLGRKIKLIKYDNQMKPDISVRMAKKAVLEDVF